MDSVQPSSSSFERMQSKRIVSNLTLFLFFLLLFLFFQLFSLPSPASGRKVISLRSIPAVNGIRGDYCPGLKQVPAMKVFMHSNEAENGVAQPPAANTRIAIIIVRDYCEVSSARTIRSRRGYFGAEWDRYQRTARLHSPLSSGKYISNEQILRPGNTYRREAHTLWNAD